MKKKQKMQNMRALRFLEPRKLEVQEVAMPVPGPEDVLLRIRACGICGSDSIIEAGVVKEYFINSYMAGKLQMTPTVEDATRPKVLPWPCAGLDRDAILRRCGSGILVTDFNGGNSNPVTGDFSYGIEGYLFEDGRIVRPVSGMLMTGNLLTLWSRLLAAGDDARPCQSKLIPTLAFEDVAFSGC